MENEIPKNYQDVLLCLCCMADLPYNDSFDLVKTSFLHQLLESSSAGSHIPCASKYGQSKNFIWDGKIKRDYDIE